MSLIGVDLGELDRLVARMAAFEQQLDTLDAEVGRHAGRLRTGWRGATAEAQRETQRRWSAGAAEMRTALTQLRALAATAHANYEAAVRANAVLWCR